MLHVRVFVVFGLTLVLGSGATDLDKVAGKADPKTLIFPTGDPQNCPLKPGTDYFEVLTGTGWDNLRNLEMGKVLDSNYSKCLLSEDRKYLIPDGTFVIPIKRSEVALYAEYFDHWSQYTDTTSKSINADISFNGGFFGASASFSNDFTTVKSHMAEDKSKAVRIQMRYHLYTMKAQPDAPLHPSYKNRLLEIAAHIQVNNSAMVRYLSDLVVLDYGTHYITSIDAGGVLVKEDTIKESYVKDQSLTMEKLKAQASAHFFVSLHVGFSYNHATKDTEIYTRSCTYSHVKTYGGPAYGGNFTVDDWHKQLDNGLVGIDHTGSPLYFTVTNANFPELPDYTLLSLADSIEQAIDRYFMFNTYRGCTDPSKKNFALSANVDDGNCESPSTNFTFGGIYQICTSFASDAGDLCQYYSQVNPLTNGFTCTKGYTPILLHSETVTASGSQPCRKCHKCGWFHLRHCCHTETCGTSSNAEYKSYWCAATGHVNQNSGYMFGGFYSTNPPLNNPLTQSTNCPSRFYPLKFLDRYMFICISDDYELGFIYSAPFAGFFSCITGNPLAVHTSPASGIKTGVRAGSLESFFAAKNDCWPKLCPNGYSQHLMKVQSGCEVLYCIQTGALSSAGKLPNIKLPPYSRRPHSRPNVTDNMMMITTSSNQVMMKAYDEADWVVIPQSMVDVPEASLSHTTGQTHGMSAGSTIGMSVGITLLAGLVIGALVFGVRRRRIKTPTSQEHQLIVEVTEEASDTSSDIPSATYGSTAYSDNV